MSINIPKPTPAFIGTSWAALFLGTIAYFVGLFNADIGLGEKGYYLVLMLYGLFGVVSLQKTVRDKEQGLPVTSLYVGIAWSAVLSELDLMAIGLWNASFGLSEKGINGMAYALSLFGAVAVQKNVRDMEAFKRLEPDQSHENSWLKPNLSSWNKSAPDDSSVKNEDK